MSAIQLYRHPADPAHVAIMGTESAGGKHQLFIMDIRSSMSDVPPDPVRNFWLAARRSLAEFDQLDDSDRGQ